MLQDHSHLFGARDHSDVSKMERMHRSHILVRRVHALRNCYTIELHRCQPDFLWSSLGQLLSSYGAHVHLNTSTDCIILVDSWPLPRQDIY